MGTIVYQVDKRSGRKYAYLSEPYWDKNKHAPRSKRTYLGKVDEETGEIIYKKKKEPRQQNVDDDAASQKLRAKLQQKEEQIEELNKHIDELQSKYDKLLKAVETIGKITIPFVK